MFAPLRFVRGRRLRQRTAIDRRLNQRKRRIARLFMTELKPGPSTFAPFACAWNVRVLARSDTIERFISIGGAWWDFRL